MLRPACQVWRRLIRLLIRGIHRSGQAEAYSGLAQLWKHRPIFGLNPTWAVDVGLEPTHLVNRATENRAFYQLFGLSSNCLDKLITKLLACLIWAKFWSFYHLIQGPPKYYMAQITIQAGPKETGSGLACP